MGGDTGRRVTEAAVAGADCSRKAGCQVAGDVAQGVEGAQVFRPDHRGAGRRS